MDFNNSNIYYLGMTNLKENMLFHVILGITFVLAIVVIYFKYKYEYWSKRGLHNLIPRMPFGNFKPLLTGQKCMSEVSYDIYKELKCKGHKHGGLFFINTPVYMPVDPVYIRNILSTDFEYFNERGVYFNEKKDPLAAHLFNLPNQPWKSIRAKLTPTFTSGKLKMMFPIMLECSKGLVPATDCKNPIDINDISIRYTVDIIGSCAFGIQCNSLKDPNAEFKRIAQVLTNPPTWSAFKFFTSLVCPKLAKLANFSLMQEEVKQFFINVVKDTIDYREKNKINRNDFMQLLINIKKYDEENDKCDMVMSGMRLTAQAYVFFAAGYETSSMTINLCLFELSQNEEIQDKVRAEIRRVMNENGAEITYDGLMSMTYLEKVFQETLRKYPALGYLNRVCTKKYKVPESDVVLEKGTMVLISLLGIHRDPDYYENPECFDPERFSTERKLERNPYTYLPFGEGYRNCIGARFGMVQTKICLAVLLANFKYKLNNKTKLPLKFNSASFTLALQNEIWLDATKLED